MARRGALFLPPGPVLAGPGHTARPPTELPLQAYPERADPKDGWLARVETWAEGVPAGLAHRSFALRARLDALRIARAGRPLRGLDDAALAREVAQARADLRRRGLSPARVRRAFALVREMSHRVLGLRHRDVQVMGALAMIGGRVAEMDTGEGKTITAALAAATAALAGEPVHVVTVTDYLAERDADTTRPLYEALGLRVGVIKGGLTPEERRAAYRCDVVFASNKEIAFDYLRDRLALAGRPRDLGRRLQRLGRQGGEAGPPVVMRGLVFAIVDEADSVLVDEGRTPLIISKQSDAKAEREWAEQAMALAGGMAEGTHYRLRREERRVELLELGRTLAQSRTAGLGGLWDSRIRREESVRQALSARLLFQPGEHYLVQDGKVQIVDEYTGRLQPDRSWSDGLHQLVEFKEGVEVTPRNMTAARMTYQRFFRRYQRLSGMTGTAREVRGELWAVFRLGLARIPPNQPPRMRRQAPRILASAEAKWRRVAAEVVRVHATGRPVLVGTRSVLASQIVSARLAAAGIAHEVLNAENDQAEAEIIARAGARGAVTVATNMAGRGVDIKLAPEVVTMGGLHVVLTERHDAGRIDRQLEGRAARRGEPGSAVAILSLEDPLVEQTGSPLLRRLAALPFARGARERLMLGAQRRAERLHSRARRELVRQDRRLGTILAFAGGLE